MPSKRFASLAFAPSAFRVGTLNLNSETSTSKLSGRQRKNLRRLFGQ